MTNIQPITFDFRNVKGISTNQLQQHYKLYEGYVNKINSIWTTLRSSSNFPNSNTTYSELRSLKLGESYALNGVKLHELYFENMSGQNTTPHGKALSLVTRDYGSLDNFYNMLTDVALSVRGWAVVAIDSLDRSLHIFGCDAHDVGSIFSAYPFLVLDVYEHAYMIDFGIDRKTYLSHFLKNIDWHVLNSRLDLMSSHGLI